MTTITLPPNADPSKTSVLFLPIPKEFQPKVIFCLNGLPGEGHFTPGRIEKDKSQQPVFGKDAIAKDGEMVRCPHSPGDVLTVVLSEVGKAVECTHCGLRKAPRGRDAPAEMAGGICDFECPGYDKPPLAGHLWPGETSESFGYPKTGSFTVTDIRPVDLREVSGEEWQAAGYIYALPDITWKQQYPDDPFAYAWRYGVELNEKEN